MKSNRKELTYLPPIRRVRAKGARGVWGIPPMSDRFPSMLISTGNAESPGDNTPQKDGSHEVKLANNKLPTTVPSEARGKLSISILGISKVAFSRITLNMSNIRRMKFGLDFGAL
jgi:hypothetical protein